MADSNFSEALPELPTASEIGDIGDELYDSEEEEGEDEGFDGLKDGSASSIPSSSSSSVSPQLLHHINHFFIPTSFSSSSSPPRDFDEDDDEDPSLTSLDLIEFDDAADSAIVNFNSSGSGIGPKKKRKSKFRLLPSHTRSVNVALDYRLIGRLDDSLQILLGVAKSSPFVPQTYRHIGELYEEMGQYERAVDAFMLSAHLLSMSAQSSSPSMSIAPSSSPMGEVALFADATRIAFTHHMWNKALQGIGRIFRRIGLTMKQMAVDMKKGGVDVEGIVRCHGRDVPVSGGISDVTSRESALRLHNMKKEWQELYWLRFELMLMRALSNFHLKNHRKATLDFRRVYPLFPHILFHLSDSVPWSWPRIVLSYANALHEEQHLKEAKTMLQEYVRQLKDGKSDEIRKKDEEKAEWAAVGLLCELYLEDGQYLEAYDVVRLLTPRFASPFSLSVRVNLTISMIHLLHEGKEAEIPPVLPYLDETLRMLGEQKVSQEEGANEVDDNKERSHGETSEESEVGVSDSVLNDMNVVDPAAALTFHNWGWLNDIGDALFKCEMYSQSESVFKTLVEALKAKQIMEAVGQNPSSSITSLPPLPLIPPSLTLDEFHIYSRYAHCLSMRPSTDMIIHSADLFAALSSSAVAGMGGSKELKILAMQLYNRLGMKEEAAKMMREIDHFHTEEGKGEEDVEGESHMNTSMPMNSASSSALTVDSLESFNEPFSSLSKRSSLPPLSTTVPFTLILRDQRILEAHLTETTNRIQSGEVDVVLLSALPRASATLMYAEGCSSSAPSSNGDQSTYSLKQREQIHSLCQSASFLRFAHLCMQCLVMCENERLAFEFGFRVLNLKEKFDFRLARTAKADCKSILCEIRYTLMGLAVRYKEYNLAFNCVSHLLLDHSPSPFLAHMYLSIQQEVKCTGRKIDRLMGRMIYEAPSSPTAHLLIGHHFFQKEMFHSAFDSYMKAMTLWGAEGMAEEKDDEVQRGTKRGREAASKRQSEKDLIPKGGSILHSFDYALQQKVYRMMMDSFKPSALPLSPLSSPSLSCPFPYHVFLYCGLSKLHLAIKAMGYTSTKQWNRGNRAVPMHMDEVPIQWVRSRLITEAFTFFSLYNEECNSFFKSIPSLTPSLSHRYHTEKQSIYYNVGRAFHSIGHFAMAIKFYEKTINMRVDREMEGKEGIEKGVTERETKRLKVLREDGSEGPSEWSLVRGLSKCAAHNLSRIYLLGGNEEMASRVYKAYANIAFDSD